MSNRADWTLERKVPPPPPFRWTKYDELWVYFMEAWPYSAQWSWRHMDEMNCWPWGWATEDER